MKMVEKLGAIASIGCLIHCLAAPFAAILFPALGVGTHSENETLEIFFWLVAGVSLAIQSKKMPVSWILTLVFPILLGGTFGILTENHEILHFAFFAIAGLSIAGFIRHRRECTPQCCAHDDYNHGSNDTKEG